MIIMYSNATPFLQKIDTGYVCCYCREQFQDPADLKKHNQEIHGDKYDPVSPNVIMNSRKADICIKLDITGLKCKLCSTDIPSLEELKDHLQKEHEKNIFTDVKNKMIPFKFESEEIRCCICSNVFEKFRKLQEHMHSHYRNYICEQCDLGFLTLKSLKSHAAKHKLGEFKCQYCPKIYDTYRKKKSHEKAVHVTGYLLSRCGYCNERFTSTKNKDEHLAKVHGVQLPALKCQACDRTFENKRALTIHTKRDHLMERKHKCSQCEMSFFNSSSLKMHAVKHSGLKDFQCDICQKSYAQKKTLKQHMRVHFDERRYKCELCDQAFVKKYSLNTHVKNIHGDKQCNQETMGKTHRNKTLEQAVLVIVGPEEKAKLQVNTKPETQVKTRKNELWKHYNNIGHILKCSIATPIQRRGAVGFVCSYCFEEYPDPADLKKHTLAVHTSKTDPTLGYPKIPNMSEYSIKLDITDLKCTICAEPIDSLEDLVTHIQDEHNKKIYSDIPNHFIPFKFSTADFTCCLCDMTSDKFKILQEHMHSHYRNYVCEECNAGFVTRGSYLRHCSTHIKGDFPCRYCPKVYNTLSKKKSHERFNHIKAQMYPNRCTYCDKSFKEYYRKERHMTEVHGAQLPLHKCNACDKIYKNKARLLVHVKRDHLLERRFKCTICDMSFFTSTDVKNHMVTHTGERNFQCGICRKSYGRRTTLSSHMKIHHNDRRFKCEFCGMSFVQKCSWKSHCKSLHGHDVE